MLRILIAMLLLAGCTTTSPPPPTATAPPMPTQTPRRQPPPPPPKDWLEVLVDSLGHRVPPSGEESKTFSYRAWPTTTMYVVFHNVGDEPITAPKITFVLEQREPTPELGTELETHFTGATGEGWKCSGSQGARTCSSKATVAPGEAMPTIELEIKPVAPRSTSTHFTATHGDLLYEAVVHYDTST